MSLFSRRCAVFAAAVLLAGPSRATAEEAASLSGAVVDHTGASVAGARVELVGAQGRSTLTDGAGRYRLEGLETGDYTLRVAAPGFRGLDKRVHVAASGAVVADFQLELEARGESVSVTAERMRAEVEAERRLTPGGVTVVETSDLLRRHVSGLADMMRYVPGVWAESSSGSEELFISSRGSNLDATDYDKNGVKLLQDGLPVTTADGNNHNRVIDPLSARYASVARGANALTYGASTLGGAIDFVSPTARSSAPVSLFVDAGSHGSLNGRVTAGGSSDRLDGLLTLEGRRWDGYRDHSGQERWGVYGNAGWRLSDAAGLRVFATYVHNDQRLPGALTRDEVAADPDQASAAALDGNYGKVVKTARVAAKANWSFGPNGSLAAGLSYEKQSLYHPIVNRIFVDFDGPGPGAPVEVFSLLVDTDHRDLGAMLRYDRRLGGHDLLAGLNYGNGMVEGGNYRNLEGRPNGLSESVDNGSDALEVFAVDRWRASDRFTVVLGGQAVSALRDVRTTNATTGAVSHPSERFSSFNPRAGAIVAFRGVGELYANLSRLYEAPTTFEMQDDVRGGDAVLDPMTGTVAELGWRSGTTASAGTRLTWDVAAYYARIRDEILSVDDPAAPGNSLTTNVDRTIHAGLEALLGASVDAGGGHRIEPQVSVTLNRFRFDGDAIYGDNRLPAAPTYAVRGEVLYRRPGGLYAGPTFDLVGERYADFANTYAVEAYGLLGLRAGFTGRRIELFGELRNLLDEEYLATLSVLNAAAPDARVLYPGAPVSAYVGARLSF
jgi:iron complex outermembrane receptor protein